MMQTPDLDHTSFAVHDGLAWARRLRSELGAVPVCGEVLPEFRYLMLWVGTADDGAMVELLDPVADGFLSRSLNVRGEGPHHVTFMVPDVRASVAAVRELGFVVTGEEYDHSPWQEAFIVPEPAHRTVIQLAQTDRSYPTRSELLATQERDVATFPSTRGATDPLWWANLWDTECRGAARLGATLLGSSDLARSRELFVEALGAQVEGGDDALTFTWPSGSLEVRPAVRPGITGMRLADGPANAITIGKTALG
ncbi:MAG: VOC family protein [Phycicoccus sp.]|nr:VOC family protein [Phycicoccus sp.]